MFKKDIILKGSSLEIDNFILNPINQIVQLVLKLSYRDLIIERERRKLTDNSYYPKFEDIRFYKKRLDLHLKMFEYSPTYDKDEDNKEETT